MAVVEYISLSFGKKDRDILEWLKEKSKEKGIPISTLIKQILREYIKIKVESSGYAVRGEIEEDIEEEEKIDLDDKSLVARKLLNDCNLVQMLREVGEYTWLQRMLVQYDSGQGLHPKQIIEDTLKDFAEKNNIDFEVLKKEFCEEFEYLCNKLSLKS